MENQEETRTYLSVQMRVYFFICRSLNWAWILIKPVGNAVDFGGLSVLAEGLGITYELLSKLKNKGIKFPPFRVGLRKASQPIITVLIYVAYEGL